MIEISGVERALVTRSFWRVGPCEDFVRTMIRLGWDVEEIGDVKIIGRLRRYTVTLLAPKHVAREQARARAVAELAEPGSHFTVVPTLIRPPRPALDEQPRLVALRR